jgi:predicted 3-demethylubiquinone-9 3-methyltransferase (glyoxalase superfamily)
MLSDMMQDKDADKTNRVMQAILQMKKLDIARLQEAYGRSHA